MTDDDRIERVQEAIRAREARPPQRGQALDPAFDELLAALEAGTETLDGADEPVLGRALARHGVTVVSEALAAGAASRAAWRGEGQSQRSLGGDSVSGDSVVGDRRVLRGPWYRRPTVLALAAAALLGVVALLPRLTRDVPDVEVAWAELADRTDRIPSAPLVESLALVPEVGGPGWGAAARGAEERLPVALRRRVAIVHVGDSFGSAVLLDDDGWLLTSSALVAEAVERAAWEGDEPRLEVELVDVDANGRTVSAGARRSALVYRHVPRQGLSLLGLQDVSGLLGDPLQLGASPPPEGAPVEVLGASSSDVAGGAPGTFVPAQPSARWTTDEQVRDLLPETLSAALGAPYRLGTLGAPVIADARTATPRLVGVVLGGDDQRTWCAPVEALHAVANPRPTAIEPYPIDPWFLPLGGARSVTRWDTDGRSAEPTLVVRTEDLSGSVRTALFATARSNTERAARPFGLVGAPGAGDFTFDVVVILASDRKIAIGRTDDSGILTQLWAGHLGGGAARVFWRRDGAGDWRHETLQRESMGSAELLGRDAAASLTTLLRSLELR